MFLNLRHLFRTWTPLTCTALFFTGQAFPLSATVDEAYGPVIARPLVWGLSSPVYVTAPPGETRWLFILQKGGAIRMFDREAGQLAAENLLTVSPISTNSERGLLGLAFHPNFAANGYFFINFTNGSGHTVVRRYTMATQDPYSVAPGSALDLIVIQQPAANHNAGWIDFSPIDDYLYISLGDGGGGNDPQDNGQNKNTLLGSMLRIDVDGDDFPGDSTRNYRIPADNPFVGAAGRDEIWAYGLRNPWRNSFDRETGDLWIADVGQSNREEINFQSAVSAGGENYGWRLREGTIATPTPTINPVGGDRPPGNVDPIYEYDFSDGSKAISGGYVYRGESMPQLRGHYFFGDYVANFVKSFRYEGSGMVDENDVVDWTATFGNILNPVSFGEDGEGELFIVSLFGHNYQVSQITQAPWYLWRNRHFSDEQIQDPEISGPAADPLKDGLANLLKYALGLNPLLPGETVPVQVAVEEIDEQSYLTLTVAKAPEATDIFLVVEVSGSLDDSANWSAAETVVLIDTAEELRVRDAEPVNAADRRFLRLRADFVQP